MNKLMNKVRKNKKGFTLIELIVVIAILGILVLLAAPRFLGYIRDANVAAMQADAKVLSNAALVYNIENEGKWPTDGVEKTITIGGVDVTIEGLDSSADGIGNEIQTLKGKWKDYALVVKEATIPADQLAGDKDEGVTVQPGDVVFVGNGEAGIKDRANEVHYGTNIELKAAADESGK